MSAIQAEANVLMATGFESPVHDSARAFRGILKAMSQPGDIVNLGETCAAPEALPRSAATALLTMTDFETSVWIDPQIDAPHIRDYLLFHSGTRFTETPDTADFALVTPETDRANLDSLPTGTDERPEKSATLVMLLPSLSGGLPLTLSGPGIEDTTSFAPSGLEYTFWTWFSSKSVHFPRGLDIILASGEQLAAITRSTKVEF